ncbi:hypothetical protein D1872_270070 [compost metagenome]
MVSRHLSVAQQKVVILVSLALSVVVALLISCSIEMIVLAIHFHQIPGMRFRVAIQQFQSVDIRIFHDTHIAGNNDGLNPHIV